MKCSIPALRDGLAEWKAEIGGCVQDFLYGNVLKYSINYNTNLRFNTLFVVTKQAYDYKYSFMTIFIVVIKIKLYICQKINLTNEAEQVL